MSKRDLLLEVGLEEMPARFVANATAQFQEKVEKWLQAERLQYERIQSYETPRRFALIVAGLAEKQADRDEEAKGPAKKIAQDETGAWTKAALGFARSNGVEPEELYLKEVNGVEYVFARKREAGKETVQLLPALNEVITGMNFPKNMRWGAHELRYARPIRWLVALFGSAVIDLEVAGVKAGRITRGHRFLGQEVAIETPDQYEQKLAEQFVIADPQKRQAEIVKQLRELADEKGWHIPVDEGLLDEVVHLVEYPTVLFGSFDPAFLSIPREVLITSMREHQRYFPVEDKAGQLLNHFVTVRNGNAHALENVAKGNEKVLRARLSDARFFYEEDQKLSIEHCLKRLESIVFHEELGTIGDKVRRIRRNAGEIAKLLAYGPQEQQTIDRIAEIAKFDLVTNMVGEFPELQGIMGEDYARKAGESESVARGVSQHYLPRFAGDDLPDSAEAAIVSIADKLDTIAGCFLIGIIPTGSQDPYGLRRMATGVIHILHQRGWNVSLEQLWQIAIGSYQEKGVGKRSAEEVKHDLAEFFILRLRTLLQEEEIRYDLIDAVLATDIHFVPNLVARAKALAIAVQAEEFKWTVEQFNRVYNLAQKADSDQVAQDRLVEASEQQLYEAYRRVTQEVEPLWQQGEFPAVLEKLAELREPIQRFFDQVMVMAEDEQIRRNRLAMLRMIANRIYAFADFTKIVFA
ncbi:glycine--tRNA ligase subunit beta [Brevibacillus fulvus]|uniref:Glycine--tRNA ligase beta subunit n=1 Tax=Brevibacillus fulvus TaxID=1125967 RepID=A0A939BRP2_9BACL|nr:glycine--tRNA ligase subunit beta [Brevibacillus fulvus]MBM7589847.1 glycyl-tRNA synthetase beta chain [Brevibacillus fulvus]